MYIYLSSVIFNRERILSDTATRSNRQIDICISRTLFGSSTLKCTRYARYAR